MKQDKINTYLVGWEADSFGEECCIKAESLEQAEQIAKERLLECVNSYANLHTCPDKIPEKLINIEEIKK